MLLRLRSDDRFVLHYARRAYEPLLCGDEVDGNVHNAAIAARRRDPWMSLDGQLLPWPSDINGDHSVFASAFYGTRELFARLLCTHPERRAIYSAAIETDAGAVVLIGRSTIGKTVLALHATALGARLYSDETVLLDRRDGRINGVGRRLMVREPALPLLPNDAMRRACLESADVYVAKRSRLFYALDPSALFGRNVDALPALPAAVVCIDDERTSHSVLERISPALAAAELAKRSYGPSKDLAEVATLGMLLARARSFRLRLGSPDEAARMILEAVS